MGSIDDIKSERSTLVVQYGDQAFLLIAMGLHLRTLNYEDLFRDHVLDGSDDKKIDFCKLDLETGEVTIAQAYQSSDWSRKEAPANKASELATAVNWLIVADLPTIPEGLIRDAALEIRDALEENKVTSIEVLYVHNLPPSVNVSRELDTVLAALRVFLEPYSNSTAPPIRCTSAQVSIDTVVEWMEASQSAISINENFKPTPRSEPQVERGQDWESMYCSVSADQLVRLSRKIR